MTELPPEGLYFTDAHGNREPLAHFIPADGRITRAYDADDHRGRRIVDVICPDCSRNRLIASVYESPEGPLYIADPPAPAGAHSASIEWAREAGYSGHVPPTVEVVRVLVDDPAPGIDGECWSKCSQHGRLIVAIEELRSAIAEYRATSKRRAIRAHRAARL